MKNKKEYILTHSECPDIYQYSAYKPSWVLEIKNDFGDFYTATVVSMFNNKNEWYEHTTIAVRKEDCNEFTAF